MRARFEDVPWSEESSFLVRSYDLSHFAVPWHFHPELELTLIQEGQGDRCVGDHLGSFAAGDLVLLGPGLPHYWRSTLPLVGARARAVVVHWREDSFGAGFAALPENRWLKQLVVSAQRGLHFTGTEAVEVGQEMALLMAAEASARLLAFLRMLHRLAHFPAEQVTPLASVAYSSLAEGDPRTADRMRRVYDHLYDHLDEEITLPEVARVAGMSDAAFSRYCKKATGKTLTHLLTELRVSRACKLLTDTSKPVSEIAFLSGFQSLSNFNRAFAASKKQSPSRYRDAFQSSLRRA